MKGKKYTPVAVYNKRLCKGSLQKHADYVSLILVLLCKILEACVVAPSLVIKGTIKDFQVYTPMSFGFLRMIEYCTDFMCGITNFELHIC